MTDTREKVLSSPDEHAVRKEKVESLRRRGIEPWPEPFEVRDTCKDIVDEFTQEEESLRSYAIAGRIMTLRSHGKTAFAHVQDNSGRVQVYIRQDDIGQEAFELWQSYIDIGDIVGFRGTSFKTKTGEITLKVEHFVLLSKCLYPLPDKFHGVTDIETKYRQRYLDLIADEDSKVRFYKRFQAIRTLRAFLDAHGFLEVETPMLHVIPGGAAARPFVTHHNTLDIDLYLRIAPELHLKRLVVGGFERVYELNRCFRNEGISTRHNPEFTTVELYVAHQDYHWMMDFIEKLLRKIVLEVRGSLCFSYNDMILDFEKPFERMSMRQAVAQKIDMTESDLTDTHITTLYAKYVQSGSLALSVGERLYALFEILVEPHLISPTFITEFPVEVSPLSKRNVKNPDIADRFELFVARMELANGFNELNDPEDQASRFKQQASAREAGDEEAHYYDADFIKALEYGLPPTVGAGIGIDRLAMLITDAPSIRDVILFPTLKPKHD